MDEEKTIETVAVVVSVPFSEINSCGRFRVDGGFRRRLLSGGGGGVGDITQWLPGRRFRRHLRFSDVDFVIPAHFSRSVVKDNLKFLSRRAFLSSNIKYKLYTTFLLIKCY